MKSTENGEMSVFLALVKHEMSFEFLSAGQVNNMLVEILDKKYLDEEADSELMESFILDI